ncbi:MULTISPECIES: hypothetical protein [Xanthomonas]|uniref:Uncharacterized protein n=1 Tax=Xanthomonas cucurbitae TaxID=56453 RepID=A0ABY7YIP2_9XANT|nr:hypothetical protein [Xanthomonas cucurbitae]WDM69905.1 hypothetical protein K6981_14815 [Xanthomonas cucurbitae]WDM73778.1 hypothetical protein K6978_14785 [Xanthomonas cucurbitae]WDM84805.1 hypothetical protein K6979_04760 [Xanthomonas cucurbitae]
MSWVRSACLSALRPAMSSAWTAAAQPVVHTLDVAPVFGGKSKPPAT